MNETKQWCVRNIPSELIQRVGERTKELRISTGEAVSTDMELWLDQPTEIQRESFPRTNQNGQVESLEIRIEALERRLKIVDSR